VVECLATYFKYQDGCAVFVATMFERVVLPTVFMQFCRTFVVYCLMYGNPWFGRMRAYFNPSNLGMRCYTACCIVSMITHPLQRTNIMYHPLLNRLVATLMLSGLCLQSCRSSFQVVFEDSVLEESLKTSNDEQAISQVLGPAIQSPDGSNSRLLEVSSAPPPSVATSPVQMTLPTGYPAVEPAAMPTCEQVSSTEPGELDAQPAAPPVVRSSSESCLASLRALSLQPSAVFGAQAWRRYFGEVGESPLLPPDIVEILHSACPFWPGKVVKDTHLLVLIPSTVAGKAFTLDLLEDLIQSPRGDGHNTQYFLYDEEVQRSLGDEYPSSSYWVLMTRDVLPGSGSKSYTAQQALVAQQSSHMPAPPYAIPSVLEAATAILSHYVRSGDRLYEELVGALSSTSTRCAELLGDGSGYPSLVTVGRFCARGLVFLSGFDDDAEFGISCLRRFGTRHYRPSALLHSFGAEEWSRYFGDVGVAPPLPAQIVDTLNGPCPFWPGKAVKDTHLLVLIPTTVDSKPFSLDLLGELVRHPKSGGYSTKYDYYDTDVRAALGARSPIRPYWVLMTRNVLEGTRGKQYASQQALVAAHAKRTGLPYELPGALEAATTIFAHCVRSGECLYVDAPLTYTRCQELIDNQYSVVVGGFASGGLDVSCSDDDVDSDFLHGVASLRKF
jgi:hypothetical protein